jgi:extracellular factor (EF) 3-hydroxypalmitic acid methyl ester biosynthesis protein
MTLLTNPPVGRDVFDHTHDAIAGGDVDPAMTRLRGYLRDMRSRLDPDEWSSVGEQARRHPLYDLLLESPFTRHAFEKPRGYARRRGIDVRHSCG